MSTTTNNTESLTLKALRLNLTFSRETYCFTAKVYLAGKDVAYAENDGNGGCTCVHLSPAGVALGLDRKAVEEKVDALVHEAAEQKDKARMLRTIRKDMLTKVLFIKAGEVTEGAYSYCKHNGTPEGAARADAAMRAKYPDAVFLNGLSDCALLHALGL